MRLPGTPRTALWTSLALLASTGCASPGAGASIDHPGSKAPISAGVDAAASAPASGPEAAAAPPAAAEGNEPQPVPIPVAGTDFVHGRATVKVNATLEKVRE